MHLIADGQSLRMTLAEARCAGHVIGLVPTMGALHQGHLTLVAASARDASLTVMSIYVNPTQFGVSEDFSSYPRDLDRDLRLAEAAGVDIAFTPTDDEMYPGGRDGQSVWVDPGKLGSSLEGEYRPGHFRGVATVVAKLFNIVKPDIAYFGQKDAQQAVIVRRLASDLNTGVDVRVIPTVREPDGLALSSRNVYLTPEQRCQAPALYSGLTAAETDFASGERDAVALIARVREIILADSPAARVQYVAINDAETLAPIAGTIARPALLSLAAHFGSTRLIDNVVLIPPG